jgi:hypothetical protein
MAVYREVHMLKMYAVRKADTWVGGDGKRREGWALFGGWKNKKEEWFGGLDMGNHVLVPLLFRSEEDALDHVEYYKVAGELSVVPVEIKCDVSTKELA